MDPKKVNLKKVIKEYLKNFPKNLKVERIFLFGSYATGKVTKDSDIDLIVISPIFKGMSFIKRLELLSRLRQGLTKKVAMDILGYTPEEFEMIDKESIIMKQAKREGKIIYEVKR